MTAERMQILELLSHDEISVEEAHLLIEALHAPEGSGDEAAGAEQPDRPSPEELAESVPSIDTAQPAESPRPDSTDLAPGLSGRFRSWRAFWLLPFSAGLIITIFSGLLISSGARADWHWLAMVSVGFLLGLGILTILFGWSGRTAPWLHLRVNTGQDEWPRRIALSFPLPLRTAAWMMRTLGRYIPGLDAVPVPIHEALEALRGTISADDPFYIRVDESGQELVEVYIG